MGLCWTRVRSKIEKLDAVHQLLHDEFLVVLILHNGDYPSVLQDDSHQRLPGCRGQEDAHIYVKHVNHLPGKHLTHLPWKGDDLVSMVLHDSRSCPILVA